MADKPEIVAVSDDSLARAADILRAGGLVAFPTETVYGLGGDAANDKAVARIYKAKGRPDFNPLIVHVPDVNAARRLVVFDARAEALAQQFWPGPLTLVLPRAENCPVSRLASAGLDTLAVRCPKAPVAQALLKAAGCPVAAPSANRSGSLSPTTPAHVADSLGGAVDLILAGGKCAVGLESTVLDLTEDPAVILRPGSVTPADLDGLVAVAAAANENEAAPKSPGRLLKHYAPKTPLRLNAVDVKVGEALLAFGPEKFIGVEGVGAVKDMPESRRRNLSESGDLVEAAANLFAYLHDLDAGEFKAIAVMPVPEEGLGVAINDRLRRAAA